jgi:hypothetical protein
MTGHRPPTRNPSPTTGQTPGRHPILLALLAALAIGTAPAQDLAENGPWTVEVPGTGILVIEPPQGWDASSPQTSDFLVEWRATTKSRCEMVIRVTASPEVDPAFNGPDALEAYVRGQAEAFLPQAIESRYTLRSLRGPSAAGFYFGLRDRAPRRKQQVYVVRGTLGLENLRVEFNLTSPVPDPPEIQRALARIAASRIVPPAAEGETP